MGIVYISHRMDEIKVITDRVTVMRDGKLVDSFPISETNTEQLVECMVGEPVKSFYADHKSMVTDEEVLRVEDFTRWGFYHHVNFNLHRGEVLAICGLAGSGRTEIARGLTGVDKIDGGKEYIHGKEVHFRDLGELSLIHI